MEKDISEYKYHFERQHLLNPLEYNDLLFYQIGRLFCHENSAVQTHQHMNLFELTIVNDGCGTIFTNGETVAVKRGDIFLSFPWDSHGIQTEKANPLRFDFFAFNSTDEDTKLKFDIIMQNYMPADRRIFSDERINFLVGTCIAEISSDGFSCELFYHACKQIILYIIRAFSSAGSKLSFNTKRADMLCYQIMHYIDTHLDSLENLAELSSKVNYSYSHLSKVFKKTTNITISDYIANSKLEKARILLLDKKMNVSQISEKLNYSSPYSFSRAFKKHFGVSPKYYPDFTITAKTLKLH